MSADALFVLFSNAAVYGDSFEAQVIALMMMSLVNGAGFASSIFSLAEYSCERYGWNCGFPVYVEAWFARDDRVE